MWRIVHHAGHVVGEVERVLVVPDRTCGIEQRDGRTRAHVEREDQLVLARRHGVDRAHAVDRHVQVRAAVPAIAECFFQHQGPHAIGGWAVGEHHTGHGLGIIAEHDVRTGIDHHLFGHGHRDRSVVGATEVVGGVELVGEGAGSGRGCCGKQRVVRIVHQIRSGPVGRIQTSGTKVRGELRYIRNDPGIEVDLPRTDEAVVSAPEIGALVGPFAVERAAIQIAERLHGFVGACNERVARWRSGLYRVVRSQHRIIRPRAVGCGRAPAVLPTFTGHRVRIAVVVVRGTQVGPPTALLVEDHGLPVGTDHLQDQVAHVSMLHVHADGEDIPRPYGLSGAELREGEAGREGQSHIIRKEHAITEVGIGDPGPSNRSDYSREVNGGTQAGLHAFHGTRERGRCAHKDLEVHEVQVPAIIVVGHV